MECGLEYFRAAHVAEPVFILVLDHLADEFGAVVRKRSLTQSARGLAHSKTLARSPYV